LTVEDVFNVAMPLIDEAPTNGVYDVDRTADYKEKTPFILTSIQSEICRISPLYKTIEITAVLDDSGYVKVTLPSDYI
jgi:hypothetical protein